MNPIWSYALAVIGVTGLLIAATRPKVGWWFNIAAQVPWLVYAIFSRQWGFLLTPVAYSVAYVRLLRKAYRQDAAREQHGREYSTPEVTSA